MKNELLLIPGPTPVRPEILEAMGQETLSHVDPRFVASYKNAIALTRKLFKCDGEVFVLSGSGTLAMEMAILNTVGVDESLLVVDQGYFGQRFVQLGESFGIAVDSLKAPWGEAVSPQTLQNQLQKKQYKAVAVTHVDTSTGVQSDLESLVPIIKEAGALCIVDGVCATAGVDEDMACNYGGCYNIDVVLSGSQKALGVPPGLFIVAFGLEALQARKALGRIPAYYTDIYNWKPIMDDPSKYFATPAVNNVFAYEKALELIFAEGLEARYQRHHRYGQGVRTALGVYGMKAVAAEKDAAHTMSCILYPQGVDDAVFRKKCYDNKLVLAGALGEFAGRAFRIGHMGNTTESQLEQAVRIMGEVLQDMGYEADVNKAVTALRGIIGA